MLDKTFWSDIRLEVRKIENASIYDCWYQGGGVHHIQ